MFFYSYSFSTYAKKEQLVKKRATYTFRNSCSLFKVGKGLGKGREGKGRTGHCPHPTSQLEKFRSGLGRGLGVVVLPHQKIGVRVEGRGRKVGGTKKRR